MSRFEHRRYEHEFKTQPKNNRITGRDRAIEVLKPVSRVAVYRFDERTTALMPVGAKS